MIVTQRKSSFFQNSLDSIYKFDKSSLRKHVLKNVYLKPLSTVRYSPEEELVVEIFENSTSYGILNNEQIDELYSSILKRRIDYRQPNVSFMKRALLYDLFSVMFKKFVNDNRTDNLYRFTAADSKKLEKPLVVRNILINIITNYQSDFSFCHVKFEKVNTKMDFVKAFKDTVIEHNSGWIEYIGFKIPALDRLAEVMKALLSTNLKSSFSNLLSTNSFYKVTSEIMKQMTGALQELQAPPVRLPKVIVPKSECFFNRRDDNVMLAQADDSFAFCSTFFGNVLNRLCASNKTAIKIYQNISDFIFIEKDKFEEFLNTFEKVYEYMCIMNETGQYIRRSILDMKKDKVDYDPDIYISQNNFVSLATAADVQKSDLENIQKLFGMFKSTYKSFVFQIDNSIVPKKKCIRIMGDMLTIKTTATQIYNEFIKDKDLSHISPNFNAQSIVQNVDVFSDIDVFMSKVLDEKWLSFHLENTEVNWEHSLSYYIAESLYNFLCVPGSSQINLTVLNKLEADGLIQLNEYDMSVDFTKMFAEYKSIFHPRIIEFLIEKEFDNLKKVIYMFQKTKISFPWHLVKEQYFNSDKIDALYDALRAEQDLFEFKDGKLLFNIFDLINKVYILKKEAQE